MATVSWAVDADGDWETAADWSTGSLPGGTDAVVLSSDDPHIVTHSNGADAIGTLTATTDTLVVSGGSLRINGAASLAAGLTVTGGSLVLSDGEIAGGFTVSGGIFALAQGAVVSVTGAASIGAGATINGLGNFSTNGATAICDGGGSVAITGGISWNNAGTTSLGGTIVAGSVQIVNADGAEFDLAGDAANILGVGTGATFLNAGVLAKTAGGGTSEIDAKLTSTGTIALDSGTLLLTANDSISGVVSGPGTLELASGSTTTFGNLAGDGTLLSLGVLKISTTAQIANDVVQQGGSLSLATNTVLTTSGSLALLGGAIVTGLATLATNGTTSVGADGNAIFLRGGLTWSNTGALTLGNQLLTLNTATITNGAGASFALTSDAAGILYSGGNSTFVNAGLLAKTGGSGTSEIDSTLNSTGTIGINSGTLLLTANGSISGVVSGPGTLELASGSTTTFGNLAGNGTLLSLGVLKISASAQIANDIVQQGGSLSLATNTVLTTSGSLALLGGAIVTGLATLTTSGATSLGADGDAVYLRGGMSWSNTGGLTLGNQLLTLNTATISNSAGASFALTSNAAGILYSGGNSTFVNAGLLAKTGGSGTSEIDSTLNSTGTVEIDNGTLLLTTGGSISGVLSGGGTLELASASTTTFGNLVGNGTLLSLGVLKVSATTQIANDIVQQGGSLSLATNTVLTTSGSLALLGGAIVTGLATLTTSGTTSVGADGDAVYLRGGMSWINQGAATLGASLLTLNTSTITNAAGSTLVLSSDGVGILNSGGPSTLNNAGLLQKAGGVGTSEIDSTLNSTSNIEIDSGTLLLTTGGSISGVLSGSGTLELGSGSSTQLGSIGNGTGGAEILSTGLLKVAGTVNDAVNLVQQGGTISLTTGALLAVSGNLSLLDGAIVTGLATLASNGVASIGADGGAVYLRGGVTWNNHGSLSLGGQLVTLNTATITNGATASLSLISDAAGILYGGGPSTLINTGLLAKTGGTGTSEIDSKLTSTGTIAIDSGTLLLATGGAISSTLAGSGTLELGAASSTKLGNITAPDGASILSLGIVSISTKSVTIGADLAQQGGTISLIRAATLTTASSLSLADGALVTGLATLSTLGTTSVASDGGSISLRGGLTWNNQGAVTLDGQILTLTSVTFDNGAAGTFSIAADGAGIFASGGTSKFINQGLLAKTGGAGTSEIDSTLNSTGTIAVNTGTLLLATGGSISGTLAGSGTLELAATSTTNLGNITVPDGAGILSLGTVAIKTNSVTIATDFTQQGGTISLIKASTLTAASSLSLTGGALVTGLATLSTLGTTSVAPNGGTIGLRGGLTWSNAGAVTLGGQVVTLSSTTFRNGAAGTFAFASDSAGIIAGGGSSKFINQGLLAKTGGGGTSEIDSMMNSSGTIAVNTGTLLLTANATLSGTLSGAGTLELTGTTNHITGLSSTGASNLLLDAGTVSVISSSTFAGGVTVSQGTLMVAGNDSLNGGLTQTGGTISINTGITLTLDGPVALSGGTSITGSGTMITAGTVVVGADKAGLSLQHTVWSNTGTVTLDSTITSSGGADVTNAAGATFAFGADSGNILVSGGLSEFTNSGSLVKSAGNGISTLGCVLTSTSTITVAAGTLDLTGGGTISGTVNGNGTLMFGGGTFTVAASTALDVEGVAVGGGTVSIGGNAAVTLDGTFALNAGTLVLAAGDTLTLTGDASFGNGGTLTGAATLLTSGAVTIGANGSAASFSDGLGWTNSGTVTLGGQIAAGGPDTVTFVNAAGGVFDLTSDSAGIVNAGSASTFENDGSFMKTGGSGTSAIFSSVDNTGTLLAGSGTLALEYIATLGGSVGGAGGGLLFLASGANTSGSLAITDNGASASVQLAGGYADWSNSGTVSDAGQVLLGNGQAGGPAILLNAPGAAWDFTTDDAGFTAGGSVMLINGGTIAKTGGSGVSQIAFGFTNSGTIDAASGTLALQGAVSGNGTLQIEAGSTLEMGQAVQASQSVVFDGSNATLKLDAPASIAGPMQGFGAGSGIDLAGVDASDASISGNTLTVTAGGSSYSFTSAQSLSGLSAQITSDGSGGSLVTLSTAGLALASPAFLRSDADTAAPASPLSPFAHEFSSAVAPTPLIGGSYTPEPSPSAASLGFAAMANAQTPPPLALAYWHGG